MVICIYVRLLGVCSTMYVKYTMYNVPLLHSYSVYYSNRQRVVRYTIQTHVCRIHCTKYYDM